ncbi:MAG: CopD family protein, partial [Sulfuricurvum sp.]
YHVENGTNQGFIEVVEVMEMKIYKYIGVPAFWATLLSGIALIVMSTQQYNGVNVFQMGGWMHAKMTLVAILIGYFFTLGHYRLKLKENTAYKSGKFFRMYNEVPTLLLIGIVALVIVKPF